MISALPFNSERRQGKTPFTLIGVLGESWTLGHERL